MIEVTNLCKQFKVPMKEPGLLGSAKAVFNRKYQLKEAVKSASLNVGPGEILGLIGSNGAGKTTLVKMLSGIIYPTSGEAKVLGHTPWERKNELRRQISLIMGQKASLWWDLPALDCFDLLKHIYQIPNKQFNDTLSFLTETLNIDQQLKVQIRRLSLGERMKVELIAALLHNPKVVYLDEPTIGLDLTAQRAIRGFLLEYRKERSPAMILTSHYMEDIERLCKRIIILKEGHIVYDGLLSDIFEKYATHKLITAHIKSMNELKPEDFPQAFGELIDHNSAQIKVKVKREKVPEAATFLLQKCSVLDLNIEEQEIADIIESIMREGHHAKS